ncbi:MAG: PP2C family protein-serine/threonine phosphatase [bacterium]
MASKNRIKRLFDLYTSDLSYSEIERLIKKESADVYEFFTANIPKPNPNENKIRRGFKFFRGVFNAFVLRLTPARRVFYFVALITFFVGLNSSNSPYLLFAFLLLNLLLAFELADKLNLKSEMDIASKVQNGLVPNKPPDNANYFIASHYEPAKIVSGDYFDFIPLPNGDLYYFIGDISGKGMSAALYMVQVRAIIHSLVHLEYSPKELLIRLKAILCSDLRPGNFLTIIASVIKTDGTFCLSRAGHNTVYHYSPKTNIVKIVSPKGLAIGFNDKGLFATSLEEIKITTEPNDIIVFYTDGVTEAMNSGMEQFGEERFKDVIIKNSNKSVSEIRDKIVRSVFRFRGENDLSDDLTLTIFKRKE